MILQVCIKSLYFNAQIHNDKGHINVKILALKIFYILHGNLVLCPNLLVSLMHVCIT